MRIGELARKAGVTAQAVRLYERRGLIEPGGRTASGYRVYSDDDVQSLRSIKRAQQLGFSLREIKELRDLHVSGDLRRARRIMEVKLQVLRERIEWLEEIRRDLRLSLRSTPGRPGRCPAAPPDPEGGGKKARKKA